MSAIAPIPLPPDALFQQLAGRRIFVVARIVDKHPIDPATLYDCDAQNPSTWMLPAEALAHVARLGAGYGVGIALSRETKLACLDIDHAMQADGTWSPLAQNLLVAFAGAYVETSVSGTGLHIIFAYSGDFPPHGKKNTAQRIELYHERRYILLTGTDARGFVSRDCSMWVPHIVASYFPPAEGADDAEWTEAPHSNWEGPADDEELIRRMLAARPSADAVFGSRASFRDLWENNVKALARAFPTGAADKDYDASSADLALANFCAFWAGGDCDRMARLMLRSALVRGKWDRVDYFNGTILKAAKQKNYYKQRGPVVPAGTEPPRAIPGIPLPPDKMPAELSVEMRALHPTVYAEMRAARPDVLFLHNDHLPAPVAAERMFSHLGAEREFFRRGDAVVEINDEGLLSVVTPGMFRSRLNQRGRKVRSFKVTQLGDLFHADKHCGEDTAKVLLSSREVNRLPNIKLVTRMPLLVEHGGELILTTPGYNDFCGVFVTGNVAVPTVPIAEAADALHALLADFQFAEQGDSARAHVSLVSPALRMAKLVTGNALITAIEADDTQTGKGYYLEIRRTMYGEMAYLVVQKKGGVGSFDESVNQALFSGAPFISFDNLRGLMDSTTIEAAVTWNKDAFPVRVPHRGEVAIDISRISMELTSNGVTSTRDLANRMLLTRLRKQASGYKFAKFPKGRDLLRHIEAHAPYYLGCVHAVVRYWHAAGKPELETSHSFRHWVGALDWIGQNVWQTRPILEGHEGALGRIADPGLSWVRQLAIVAIRAGRVDQPMLTEALRELCRDHDLMPPGTKLDANDQTADMAIGRVMRRCFGEGNTLVVDGIQIVRSETLSVHRNKVFAYAVKSVA